MPAGQRAMVGARMPASQTSRLMPSMFANDSNVRGSLPSQCGPLSDEKTINVLSSTPRSFSV
jgi:hypothetical protein